MPALRTVALLAYAQLVEGDEPAARQVLGAMLAEAPWTRPELTLGMEWLLRALAGDRPVAEALALAAYAAYVVNAMQFFYKLYLARQAARASHEVEDPTWSGAT